VNAGLFLKLVSLEELDVLPDKADAQSAANRRMDLNRLSELIQRLKPLDRQVIVSYLEEMDAASTGEITGLSPANVAMRIHRIKNILAKQFHQPLQQGGNHAE
jgi:RNA polymerase sigma-70 factor (ECF subfamily)